MMISRTRSARLAALLLIAAAFCVVGGCATPLVSTTSTVNADGSFRRSLTYQSKFDAGKGGVTRCAPTVDATDLAGLVAPPAPGGAWLLTARQDKDGNRRIAASRVVASGEPLVGDLGVLQPSEAGRPAQPQFTNRVTVRRLGANRIEYREVLRWRGAIPAPLQKPLPDTRSLLREVLPPGERYNSAAIDRVAVALQRIVCSLYSDPGPNGGLVRPNLPEAAEEQLLRQALHKELQSASFAAIPLAAADSRETSRIADLVVTKLVRTQSRSSHPDSGDRSNLTNGSARLAFTARMPGRILATNGRRADSHTDRIVNWSLNIDTIALGDVTLTAVSETTPAHPSAR